MSYISVKDLSVGYDGVAVEKNINFTVDKGNYLCIVGENGSGKSTLMKTLLGLREPISGMITFGDGLKKNEMGYLPQQTVVQRDFPASVREIVLSGFEGSNGGKPFYSAVQKSEAQDNMKRMGIEDLAGHCYRELSGGQQQRVLLARALCATSKVLLLDEPVSGLDPIVTAQMYELIQSLNKDGVTIIMISHDVDAALKYATHILHIGESIFFGTRDAYLKSESALAFIRTKEER